MIKNADGLTLQQWLRLADRAHDYGSQPLLTCSVMINAWRAGESPEAWRRHGPVHVPEIKPDIYLERAARGYVARMSYGIERRAAARKILERKP